MSTPKFAAQLKAGIRRLRRKNSARKYYAIHSEKIRERYKKYCAQNPEARKKAFRKYYANHTEKCRERTKKWLREHPKSKKMMFSKRKAKRRSLGYNVIWEPERYEWPTVGHHLDSEDVIYIPVELHNSVSHNVFTGYNMEKINQLAFEWMENYDRRELTSLV